MEKRIKSIFGFILVVLGSILILLLFAIFLLYFKPFWPEELPGMAQATLAAAIIAGIVSILGIYLKFVFDQINSETEYNKKISEEMISKVHIYAEEYYIPLGTYAGLSASQLNRVLTDTQASTEQKQLALFFITKYLKYVLKLEIEKGGIILFQNSDSESFLEQLNVGARMSLGQTPNQLCTLQKSMVLGDIFIDFSTKIQCDNELMEIYKKFEEWLEDNSRVKEAIACFNCYNKLMFRELNVIYMPWYKKKPPELSPECKKVIQTFKKEETNLKKCILEFLEAR